MKYASFQERLSWEPCTCGVVLGIAPFQGAARPRGNTRREKERDLPRLKCTDAWRLREEKKSWSFSNSRNPYLICRSFLKVQAKLVLGKKALWFPAQSVAWPLQGWMDWGSNGRRTMCVSGIKDVEWWLEMCLQDLGCPFASGSFTLC